MITFQCYCLLKKIRKMTKKTDSPFCFSDSYTDGEYDFYCNETKRSCSYSRYKNQIQCIMKFLVNEGYLETEDEGGYYQLTYPGLHPLFRLRRWIFSSILLPAFVAFLSAALTQLLLGSACKIP